MDSGLAAARRPGMTGRDLAVPPSRLDNTKPVQGQLVVDVGEHDLDALADRDRPLAEADEVRGEAGAFVELDLRDVVGRLVRERREPGFVHHGPGADAPAAGRG